MIDFQIGRFVSAFNNVSSLVQALVNLPPGAGIGLDGRSFEDLKRHVTELRDISEACGFDVVVHCANETIGELDRLQSEPNGKFKITATDGVRVKGSLSRLKDAVISQSHTRSALILDQQSMDLWEGTKPLFGQDFKNKFPSGQYDLDEASKCLALSRSTATVFHLMRIMELGLNAVHKCLGIPVPLVGNDRNWGNILKRIKDTIANRGNKWTDKDRFQELYALLDSVKDAWRNSTMHIEKKYTQDEAKQIYEMVRGFMMKLAARMDENGEPKA